MSNNSTQQIYKKEPTKIHISKIVFRMLEILFYYVFYIIAILSWYSVKGSIWIMKTIKTEKQQKNEKVKR